MGGEITPKERSHKGFYLTILSNLKNYVSRVYMDLNFFGGALTCPLYFFLAFAGTAAAAGKCELY